MDKTDENGTVSRTPGRFPFLVTILLWQSSEFYWTKISAAS